MTSPWLKFYPSDWRSDPMLRTCSLAARGLWMEMLCLMHEAAPRGHLIVGNSAPTLVQLASICGSTLKSTKHLLAELEAAGVFSREGEIIVSRRMVRDTAKSEKDRLNGGHGGNPRLKGGVNPPDKAQKPEARSQKPESRKQESAVAPEIDLFPKEEIQPTAKKRYYARAYEVLGKNAGGVASKLLAANDGIFSDAQSIIEKASGTAKPMVYVNGAIHRTNERKNPNTWVYGDDYG